MIATIIRTDGTQSDVALADESPAMRRAIVQLIGADAGLDTVNLRDGRFMYVDDLGHSRNLPVNPEATRMYWAVCIPGTTHEIRGDVVIVGDRGERRN